MAKRKAALIGRLGPLAERTGETLSERGWEVEQSCFGESPSSPSRDADVWLLFPFDLTSPRKAAVQAEQDLRRLEDALSQGRRHGLRRVVLRSRATVYGFSYKNYGLMEEDRVSLLEPGALEQRWLRAESLVLSSSGPAPGESAACLRFASIADAGEGDFVTRMLFGKAAFPAAGYDPRVQFVSLDDAAAALVAAAESDATGIFNIAGEGCVEFRRALKATVPVRIPIARAFQRPVRALLNRIGAGRSPEDSVDQIQYSWTVSSDKAQRELGFRPARTSAQALRHLLSESERGRPERITEHCDEFGLDPEYLDTWSFWFSFLRKIYWRVETEGLEHIPRRGAALMAANHRGFMPFDGVVHRSAILEATGRHIRFLVIPSLFKFPFLSDFLIKQGGIVASQLNTARVFQRGELVGIFPEGISGAFRMYRGAYKLGNFARDAFARMAIEHQVPVIPAVVVGHVEIFPILARMNISPLMRLTGWPFIPLTPTFPLLPLPLPSKWHIRYLEPVSVSPLKSGDASNRRLVREFSNHIRDIMQSHIDEMLARRKHVFYGRIFDADRDSGRVPAISGK